MDLNPKAVAERLRERLSDIMSEHIISTRFIPHTADKPDLHLVYIGHIGTGVYLRHPWPHAIVREGIIILTFDTPCPACKDLRIYEGIGGRIVACEDCGPVFLYGIESISEAVLTFVRMTDDASGKYSGGVRTPERP